MSEKADLLLNPANRANNNTLRRNKTAKISGANSGSNINAAAAGAVNVDRNENFVAGGGSGGGNTQQQEPGISPSRMELVAKNGGVVTPVGDDGETFAATKEEEWVTKKKTEVTTTRQIETRVKRQVVLEDGKVVEDSGPIVTTNTTEDTEKQEHQETERRTLGASEDNDGHIEEDVIDGVDTKQKKKKIDYTSQQLAKTGGGHHDTENGGKQLLLLDNGNGGTATVVKEVKERRVLSREEIEETRETEDVKHLGDITDEQYLAAVQSGNSDIRKALDQQRQNGSLVLHSQPRLVHQSTKTYKTIDTEDKEEKSAVDADGRIISETKRITEHEEIKDEQLSDKNASDIDVTVQSSQRHHKTKDQEHVDYIADGVLIGREMRYTAETAEGERFGDPNVDDPDWDSLSTRMRKARRQQQTAGNTNRNHLFKQRGLEDPNTHIGIDRKDALTKRPLDFDAEEETRKEETSKWLENHFGSDSRSSRDETSSIDDVIEPTKRTHNTSYFNVTIKSKPNDSPPPPVVPKSYIATLNTSTTTKANSPDPKYYQGVSEWSERQPRQTPSPYFRNETLQRRTREEYHPTPPERSKRIEKAKHSEDSSGYRSHEISSFRDDDFPFEEPPPDYSPPPVLTPSSSPSPPGIKDKKLYQRTRFDIPQKDAKSPEQPRRGNIIGQGIRKLVGKIRSASAERKAKQKAKRRGQESRSPSPYSPTYQQFNVIDNNIGYLADKPVSTPTSKLQARSTSVSNLTSTSKSQDEDNMTTKRLLSSSASRNNGSPVQRYYLGEDPFGGSIYGRENKYDGVRPVKSSSRKYREYSSSNGKNHQDTEYSRYHHRESPVPIVYEDEVARRNSQTLGRYSRSTSRLVPNGHSNNDTIDYSRTAQTLPRNIHQYSENKTSYRNNLSHSPPTRLSKKQPGSTINVSIINTVSPPPPRPPMMNGGPAKPARTYKSTLLRSKSFNINAPEHLPPQTPTHKLSTIYKSNPHLNGDPIQLKSPGIVSSINRSQRDLPEALESEKSFIKNLSEHAPELYQTLYGPEKTRFRNNDNYRNDFLTLRKRDDNNYSESYRIGGENDFTEKSFSKKTIPSKDGKSLETIESTKTVSKSRSRNGKYDNGYKVRNYPTNGGVVIEVRNNRNK